MSSQIVIAAAKGLMMNVDKATLGEFGGYMISQSTGNPKCEWQ